MSAAYIYNLAGLYETELKFSEAEE